MNDARDNQAGGFDFLLGEWRVHHRRLKERLAGSSEWIEFAGRSIARPLIGGFGNVDENEILLPNDAYVGVTIRLYDPVRRRWSIHWFDGRRPHEAPDPPLIGTFDGGVGTFYGDDRLGERPVRVRFLWTADKPDACRWQQAFSADSGATWETNWIMDFARI